MTFRCCVPDYTQVKHLHEPQENDAYKAFLTCSPLKTISIRHLKLRFLSKVLQGQFLFQYNACQYY